jgi:AbrB family looped-hinge helix DNA binding protein
VEEFTPVQFSATLDSKGRVTVPSEVRDRIGLEPGDKISLSLDSTRVLSKSFSSKEEAMEFLAGIEEVESFSFSSGMLEVVLSD